jgi:2-phospho-L-lactate guanylyltransferase
MIAAVVPLKRLTDAKSRLSPQLGPDERERLMRDLAARTVEVLRSCPSIDSIALATPEEELALELGVELIRDPGSLNQAIQDAVRWARALGADALLVIPSDLPAVSTRDVEQLLAVSPGAPSVTVSPTHDGGTGALLMRPPGIIVPQYGPGSFVRHRLAAEEMGASVVTVNLDGFARDLDTLEDFQALGYGRKKV